MNKVLATFYLSARSGGYAESIRYALDRLNDQLLGGWGYAESIRYALDRLNDQLLGSFRR